MQNQALETSVVHTAPGDYSHVASGWLTVVQETGPKTGGWGQVSILVSVCRPAELHAQKERKPDRRLSHWL